VKGKRATFQARRKAKSLRRKRRIERRLGPREWPEQDRPMLRASAIAYDVAERSCGLSVGGIGLVHLLARRSGLVRAIDRRLHLLKVHLPYHESDHVLNIAYNVLCGGTCLEDLELRRNDEVYLDALGAQRTPDCTTAGDFCRRFESGDVEALMEAVNETRRKMWARQPASFFKEAVIEADGTIAETGAWKKEGIDLSYDGRWGYHPLLISLANTQEPLFLVNRSANRPSHEGAAAYFDRAVALCRKAGFRRITLRGDTDFSQTAYLDGWNAQDVRFVFGFDAGKNVVERADALEGTAWRTLQRPAAYEVKTDGRRALPPGSRLAHPARPRLVPAASRHIRGRVTLVWDNLAAHKSRKLREWIERHPRFRLVYLPAYAPELNPVEGLWSWLKTNHLGNVCADTLDPVVALARDGMKTARRRPALLWGFLGKAGPSL